MLARAKRLGSAPLGTDPEARMDLSRDVVMSIGLDRLYAEAIRAALTSHGWPVLEPGHAGPPHHTRPEIVLAAHSGSSQAVIDRLRHIRAQYPAAKIVLLGPGCADTDLVRFIEEGASGYVLLSNGMSDLIDVLQMIRNNRTPSSGRITQLVLGQIQRLSKDSNPLPETRLTSREQEIFRLIQDGLSNKEIASRLHIAPNTVKNHVHHLLEKLKVRNRHEAAWLRGKPSRAVPPETCTGTAE
jgi:DNA-binding NarL/FixJ family response regulator